VGLPPDPDASWQNGCVRILLAPLLLFAPAAAAVEMRVGPAQEYATIRAALTDARAGDLIVVAAGTYEEALVTVASGVTVRGEGAVVVRASGTVLEVVHDDFTVDGLVFDGAFGADDAVIVEASRFVMRHCEVRNAGLDCIDVRGRVTDTLIEDSVIHHCLHSTAANCAADACRRDSHGVVADEAVRLTIARTLIHTFSGDALQMNGRDQPTQWNDVVIEDCDLRLEPLAEAVGGYAAGVVPGENAIDTKTPDDIIAPARITVRDTTASGFRGGLIANMAAYNMKENVLATFDRVTVSDSDIAFRLRGAGATRPRGAQVRITNAVLFDVDRGVRYEDDIEPIAIDHSTFGGAIGALFQRASAPTGVVTCRNTLVLASALPAEAAGASNRAVDASAFVDAAAHDYHLADGSSAVDAVSAADALDVALDRDRVPRPQGAAADIGAYELCPAAGCDPLGEGEGEGEPGEGEGEPGEGEGEPGEGEGEPGEGEGEAPPGCGCHAMGQADGLAAALLALLVRRRRARG
jgi:hypothetical protein